LFKAEKRCFARYFSTFAGTFLLVVPNSNIKRKNFTVYAFFHGILFPVFGSEVLMNPVLSINLKSPISSVIIIIQLILSDSFRDQVIK
jgi:hypothetical protein